ncbi:hypothetical protein, partial [Rahnella variigena]|uniref:hypothetical protein n=1 Tax=Rahnella variigena TaxID=574964 RepID=UPI00244A0198
QRAGIEAVFVRRGTGGNHAAVKLGVIADGDVEAAVAREYAALVGDAGIERFRLVGRDLINKLISKD